MSFCSVCVLESAPQCKRFLECGQTRVLFNEDDHGVEQFCREMLVFYCTQFCSQCIVCMSRVRVSVRACIHVRTRARIANHGYVFNVGLLI